MYQISIHTSAKEVTEVYAYRSEDVYGISIHTSAKEVTLE